MPSGDPLQPAPLTAADAEQVEALLDDLYRSFCSTEGEEPDWELMRSVFVTDAQFVSETAAGESPEPQTVEAFIASWRDAIRSSTTPRPAHDEWITGTQTTKVGELIRVDVAFEARKSTDPVARKPGLDTLTLAKVDGAWRVLSFVVQYESKLPG